MLGDHHFQQIEIKFVEDKLIHLTPAPNNKEQTTRAHFHQKK